MEERAKLAAGLLVLPLGAIPDKILDRIMTGLTSALGISVKKDVAGLSLAAGFNRRRGQYNATRILEIIDAERGAIRGARVLAVVDVDLYADGLNFVFGEAAPSAGVGVLSVWRLDPKRFGEIDDQGLFETRAVREAVHEAGHLFGLGHCRDRRCVMSFSDSLAEVDGKSSEFCAICRSSLKKH